jgi:tetratricopeptide (TPR) repeat protein
LAGVLAVVSPSLALAQGRDVELAKEYFRAGAAAYAAGDYLAAIQALESAYAITPLPAIAFSLAQAERRQYFASREAARLARAIELFRLYLDQVKSGGRRADATDALAQLEMLAAASGKASGGTGAQAQQESAKTRLMVSCEAPKATISLDGGKPVPSPLIAEVTPGKHALTVTAPGFFTETRSARAVAGSLVPVEVELRERPAIVFVRARADADLYVDGAFAGRVGTGRRLELASGPHLVSVAKNGRKVVRMETELGPGEVKTVEPKLEWTGERRAAMALFVTSGAAFGGGMFLTALAIREENRAEGILGRKASSNIGPGDLTDYDEAIQARGQYRAGAVASFAASAGALVTGVVLFAFDKPDLKEVLPQRSKDRVRPELDVGIVTSRGSFGPSVRVGF